MLKRADHIVLIHLFIDFFRINMSLYRNRLDLQLYKPI